MVRLADNAEGGQKAKLGDFDVGLAEFLVVDPGDQSCEATKVLTSTREGKEPVCTMNVLNRRVQYTADLVAKGPDRFGNFATLPLPDVDGALAELGYGLGALRADGVILLSNYGEKYLGDPSLEPLWVELDRRETVVFVHPASPLAPAAGLAGLLVDYPFDTTRTAVQLVLNGIVDRYPGVRCGPGPSHWCATEGAVVDGV